MATVDASVKVNLRSYPDTDSEIADKLSPGDTVTVLSVDDGWANVAAGSSQGYMQTDYLKPYTMENVVLRYTSADGQSSYTLGKTLAQRQAGETELAQELNAILASAEYSMQEEKVTIATVNTGSNDVGLNLRAEASGEAEVLTVVPNGTQLRVLEEGADFSKVGYGEAIGYLMNAYLDFREGSADEVATDEEEVEEVEQITAVVVLNGSEKFARMYEGADEDARVLGRAEAGIEVEVLLVNEETGWVLVSCDGLQGYMKDTNLSFRLM